MGLGDLLRRLRQVPGAQATVAAGASTRSAAWRDLPAVQRATAGPVLISAPAADFAAGLATWQDPSSTSGGLGHYVSPAAPSGSAAGLAVPPPAATLQRLPEPARPWWWPGRRDGPAPQRAVIGDTRDGPGPDDPREEAAPPDPSEPAVTARVPAPDLVSPAEHVAATGRPGRGSTDDLPVPRPLVARALDRAPAPELPPLRMPSLPAPTVQRAASADVAPQVLPEPQQFSSGGSDVPILGQRPDPLPREAGPDATGTTGPALATPPLRPPGAPGVAVAAPVVRPSAVTPTGPATANEGTAGDGAVPMDPDDAVPAPDLPITPVPSVAAASLPAAASPYTAAFATEPPPSGSGAGGRTPVQRSELPPARRRLGLGAPVQRLPDPLAGVPTPAAAGSPHAPLLATPPRPADPQPAAGSAPAQRSLGTDAPAAPALEATVQQLPEPAEAGPVAPAGPLLGSSPLSVPAAAPRNAVQRMPEQSGTAAPVGPLLGASPLSAGTPPSSASPPAPGPAAAGPDADRLAELTVAPTAVTRLLGDRPIRTRLRDASGPVSGPDHGRTATAWASTHLAAGTPVQGSTDSASAVAPDRAVVPRLRDAWAAGADTPADPAGLPWSPAVQRASTGTAGARSWAARSMSPTARRAADRVPVDPMPSVGVLAPAPVVQRAPEAEPVEPDAPPESLYEEPGAATVSEAATSASGAATVASTSPTDVDALVRKLYDPLVRRLKAELRADRERAGRSLDLRH